jgi:hypothetical protein
MRTSFVAVTNSILVPIHLTQAAAHAKGVELIAVAVAVARRNL